MLYPLSYECVGLNYRSLHLMRGAGEEITLTLTFVKLGYRLAMENLSLPALFSKGRTDLEL